MSQGAWGALAGGGLVVLALCAVRACTHASVVWALAMAACEAPAIAGLGLLRALRDHLVAHGGDAITADFVWTAVLVGTSLLIRRRGPMHDIVLPSIGVLASGVVVLGCLALGGQAVPALGASVTAVIGALGVATGIQTKPSSDPRASLGASCL